MFFVCPEGGLTLVSGPDDLGGEAGCRGAVCAPASKVHSWDAGSIGLRCRGEVEQKASVEDKNGGLVEARLVDWAASMWEDPEHNPRLLDTVGESFTFIRKRYRAWGGKRKRPSRAKPKPAARPGGLRKKRKLSKRPPSPEHKEEEAKLAAESGEEGFIDIGSPARTEVNVAAPVAEADVGRAGTPELAAEGSPAELIEWPVALEETDMRSAIYDMEGSSPDLDRPVTPNIQGRAQAAPRPATPTPPT